MSACIYCATNKINGKRRIGYTENLKRRKKEHYYYRKEMPLPEGFEYGLGPRK